MTQTSDMLDSLKRIETSLANIETILDACLEKPSQQQSSGRGERIRDRLRRLRHNPETSHEP